MHLRLSRLLAIAVVAIVGLTPMSSNAQALFDASKVGRKNPPPPEAGPDGLFADRRAPLGSTIYVRDGNVLTMRQAPSFDAPVVLICANADRHTPWRPAESKGVGTDGTRYEFQLKAYQDARLRIERRGQPTLEFDTLWAHLVDTAGQGCDGWLRIDTPYVLEPHTGDYAASPLKQWSDRLHDEGASVGGAITLRSSVGLAPTPFGSPNIVCLAGTEVIKTGETKSDGPRGVAFKARVTKGSNGHGCRTGSVGWLRGDAL